MPGSQGERDVRREVIFHPLGQKGLKEILALEPPPFSRGKLPFQQLDYIDSYLKYLLTPPGGTQAMGTVITETHYIDRDYIEDHSVFYSRNLGSYPNHCIRLHFFKVEEATLRQRLDGILQAAKEGDMPYRDACKALSEETYLGFSVIKPLAGCPVGRTVLRTYPHDGGTTMRHFTSTRPYKTHLLGAELSIRGLAFQQQDAGVAACATTAIWSSLHHLRDYEDVASATPAQITGLASQNDLPFGRTMPSEGLSLGQMCQAVQALGVSPSVMRVSDYNTAKVFIHAAGMSGMAPILVISSGNSRHAVTLAGLKLLNTFNHKTIEGIANSSDALEAVYVHDDRIGPYVKGLFNTWGPDRVADTEFDEKIPNLLPTEKLQEKYMGKPLLVLNRNQPQLWEITHILLAMHPKIRLSFKGLYDAGLELAKNVRQAAKTYFRINPGTLVLDTKIKRGYKYVEDLVQNSPDKNSGQLLNFFSRVVLPRYVGVVNITLPRVGSIDIILDTTGTPRNLHSVAIIPRISEDFTQAAVTFLFKKYFIPHQFNL